MTETILIIDDNEDDQHLYRRALKGFSGYDLKSALNAKVGLASALEINPALILLDYNLPDMDGLEFLKRLAKHPAIGAPVIMLTGEGNESIAVEAMKSGASDYIVKDTSGGFLRLLPSLITRTLVIHAEKISNRKLKALHQAILHNVADGIIGIDANGFVLFINPSAERMLFYPRSDLIGLSVTQLLWPDGKLSIWPNHPLETAPKEMLSFYRESDFLRRANGELFPISYTASRIDTEDTYSSGWVLVFQDITARKNAELKLIHDANYDVLTGLPNRVMFYDYLEKAIYRADRGKRQLALFFIDLDGFKEVNDVYGHYAGDQLLQLVANRLEESVRTGDFVSRQGGDEFILIIEDSQTDHLEPLAQKIISIIEAPYQLMDAYQVNISASIGISYYPCCGNDINSLIDKADKAMYEVKKKGKNGYAFAA